jgi:two-component system cell cycle response regulator PopA
LGLHRKLARRGARVTAALTTFTAFDYLHHATFDAIALNAATGPEPARGVYAALRRNSRFAHTPVVMLEAARRAGPPPRSERGGRIAPGAVTQAAAIDERPEILAQRIVTLAEESRRHRALRSAFGALRHAAVADPETGLANAQFFLAHLAAMTDRAHASGAPFSLLVVRTRPDQPVGQRALSRARADFARLLEGFVRTEDLIGRLDAGVCAIAMPGADGAEAESAAERLEGLARSAAFEAGPEALGATFQFLLTARVGQIRAEDSAGDLLARTASAFRPAAAS